MTDSNKIDRRLAEYLGEKLSAQLKPLVEVAALLVLVATTVTQGLAGLVDSERVNSWSDLQRAVEELPVKSKAAMTRTLSKGWFFGWHDSLESLFGLIDRLSKSEDDAINQVMVDYYRLNLGPFGKQLIQSHPTRAAAIAAAIDAHLRMEEGGFLLSVPVFIAQADGIWAETIGVSQPFRDGAKAMKDRYGSDAEVFHFLLPLLELKASPFAMSAKRRESLPTEDFLNRHEVMHGERSDYGSEMNSLKAFSFLAFVGLHLPSILETTASPKQTPGIAEANVLPDHA